MNIYSGSNCIGYSCVCLLMWLLVLHLFFALLLEPLLFCCFTVAVYIFGFLQLMMLVCLLLPLLLLLLLFIHSP